MAYVLAASLYMDGPTAFFKQKEFVAWHRAAIPDVFLGDGSFMLTRSCSKSGVASGPTQLQGSQPCVSRHGVRGQQIENQLDYGDLWTNTGYVFTQPDGIPVVPDRVTQDFARLVREAGLPHLTLHGLRHAHATLMLTSGVHLKIVSERLGHSNIAITADTYSHVLPGMQEAAAEAVELLLRRSDSV